MNTKRCIPIACLLLAFLAPELFGATGSFVGKMEFTMSKEGKTIPMTYQSNGRKIRFDVEIMSNETEWILDPAIQRATIIIPQSKMYMERDLPTESISDSSKKDYGELMDSGERDSVIGYACSIWRSTGSNGVVHKVWLTGGIGIFYWYDGDPMHTIHEPPAMQAIRDLGLFPLRIVDMRGPVEQSRMEATQVDFKVPQDSMFVVPPNYKLMSASGYGK